MDKQHKKDRIQKLEKKLQNRSLSIYEIMQEDIAVDWFKMLNPAFISLLDSKNFGEIISYVITIGPPDNRMRSYKIPMIAAEIMSTPMPKVFQLFFMQDEENKGDIMLGRMLTYFDGQPNYVLSGYIVKILINLMNGNAPKFLQYLFKNGKIMKIHKFLESFSMVEFLLRIIIVEDILLNNKIKQRLQIFHSIVDIYCENQQSPEILENANYFLTESIIRLWSHKHKELGRFSTEIFRVVESIIDKTNLYHQQNLIIVIMKHLTNYADEAPILIVLLFKKINRQLSTASKTSDKIKTQSRQTIPRLGTKNLKLLQALTSMFVNIPTAVIIKQLKSHNIFLYLFDYVMKYQWNSILLVELQKITKLLLGPIPPQKAPIVELEKKDEAKKSDGMNYEALYSVLFLQGSLHLKMKEWIKKQTQKNRKSRGYTGFLINICKHIIGICNEKTVMGELIKKNQPQFLQQLQNYIKLKEEPERAIEGFQIVHNVAKPNYDINSLLEKYSNFFEETETINKKYQIERPSSHHIQSQQLLQQIQIENQLVYKLMTEHSEQNKKSESANEIE